MADAETLCCPECGNDQFTQTRTTRTEFVLSFAISHGIPYEVEISDECIDSGERDEDGYTCNDCSTEFDNATELSTREAYETELCGA